MTAAASMSIPELRKALVAEVRKLVAKDPTVIAAKAKITFPFSTLDLKAGAISFAGGAGKLRIDASGRFSCSSEKTVYCARELPGGYYLEYRQIFLDALLATEFIPGTVAENLFSELVARGVSSDKLSDYLKVCCPPSRKIPNALTRAGLKFQREIYQLLKARSPDGYQFLAKLHWLVAVRKFDLVRISTLMEHREVLSRLKEVEPRLFPSIAATFADDVGTSSQRAGVIAAAPNPTDAWADSLNLSNTVVNWLRQLPAPVVSGLLRGDLSDGAELGYLASRNIRIKSYPKAWLRILRSCDEFTSVYAVNSSFKAEIVEALNRALDTRGRVPVRKILDDFDLYLTDLLFREIKYPEEVNNLFAQLPLRLKKTIVDCAGVDLQFPVYPPQFLSKVNSFAQLQQLQTKAVFDSKVVSNDVELVAIIKQLYREWQVKKAATARQRDAKRYLADLMARMENKSKAVA